MANNWHQNGDSMRESVLCALVPFHETCGRCSTGFLEEILSKSFMCDAKIRKEPQRTFPNHNRYLCQCYVCPFSLRRNGAFSLRVVGNVVNKQLLTAYRTWFIVKKSSTLRNCTQGSDFDEFFGTTFATKKVNFIITNLVTLIFHHTLLG
jgi:hypothetical protein